MGIGKQINFQSLKDRAFFQLSDFRAGFEGRVKNLDRWDALCGRFDNFQSACMSPIPRSIPRSIHQIWLGGSLPPRYREWAKSWERLNEGWEYRLWDEKSILALGLHNEMAFRKTPSLGAKSDIARYEILHRLGGIYADTDFECVRPFDEIAGTCTFFAGTVFADSPVLNNGLMGAVPGHQVLTEIINALSKPIKTRDGMKVLAKSGPFFFTERFFYIQDSLDERDVVFPSTYFYPLPNYVEFQSLTPEMRLHYLRKWSFAIHYWEGSWMKPHPLRALLGRVKRRVLSQLKIRRRSL